MKPAATIAAPMTIQKRDGSTQIFDRHRIERALSLCFNDIGQRVNSETITRYTDRVIERLDPRITPTVEQVQDFVESVLMDAGAHDAARHYIHYRAEHAANREEAPIPEETRALFRDSARFFPTPIQGFQFYDKYSRFNHGLGRRETWIETVDRAVDYLHLLGSARADLGSETYDEIRQGMLRMEVMPSMRLLAMAGPAALRNNITIYNCSYQAVNDLAAFHEALLISLCGCGVGYSVERQYVEQLPRIKSQKGLKPLLFAIPDTTEGWVEAVKLGISMWFDGGDVRFDYSAIRPAGAILRVKGGQASGPEPLRLALNAIRAIILRRAGSVLRPIDAHDIMCHIGSAAVSGGVRRSAMISLFSANDTEMLNCKNGANLVGNEQRWNANNSAVWENTPTQLEIVSQMYEMAAGQRGEPGIFNRVGSNLTKPDRRKAWDFGTNPCGEISLRPLGFCNLSIAVARAGDTTEDLARKVRLATIIGTLQSTATYFPGLRPGWKENCEEERLLGVDITGQMDCPAVQNALILDNLRAYSVIVNRELAHALNINQSASITCNKPSGNSSVLLDCASGIHARFAPYYLRRVRVGAHSPLYKVMRDAGVSMFPEVGQTTENAITWVAEFPHKSPEGAITRKDRTAIQQCEYWLLNKVHWTEHNPSVTISYRPDEVIDLIAWVDAHKEMIGGMSFLPIDDAKYDLMPYEEISAEEYERRMASFPEIDWSKIVRYEISDMTKAAQELACVAGQCELP